MKDIPMHFLRHLMALNIQEAFRSFDFNHEAAQGNREQDPSSTILESVHPLDVLCGLLHCSDNFLRQEILKRMSMCQVPLPLLLPAGEDTHGTFLLWALRGVTKSLSQPLTDQRKLTEESVVNMSLPVFSFVSLGDCRCMSIAKIINQVLTTTQQRNENSSIHRAMSWGNIPRRISNGLVEISWYFPDDQMDLRPYEKPFAVTNLHGELQSNMKQFSFLTQVSCAVFIIIENMTAQQLDPIIRAKGNNTNCYFIVQGQFNQDPSQYGGHLLSDFGLSENILMESDEKFDEKLKFILKDTIQKSPKQLKLSEMSVEASKFDFCVDENQPGCEYGRLHSLDLLNDIVSTTQCNTGYVQQQQHLKLQIAKSEKELYRLLDQGELRTEDYRSMLNRELCKLKVDQYHHDNCDIRTNLQYAFTYLNKVDQQYFLRWIQLHQFCPSAMLAETIQEDVICKIGQMYETTLFCDQFIKTSVEPFLQYIVPELIDGDTTSGHIMWIIDLMLSKKLSSSTMLSETIREDITCKIGQIYKSQSFCANFPKAAVDLLLQGIPLELIDGETVSIHPNWITDVLRELDSRTRGKCRIKVISILGVQGTGKTTLLNTMFGLQFPMVPGQGTRGTLMYLIKVEERDLGCDFLVVIDCDGLRSLDGASVEESYDHDNELATLVIGLSDIAIINVALGSTSEMKDIMQIGTHALLRMKGTGQKPNYLLVYQNIEGASSEEEPQIEDEELLHLGAKTDKSGRFPEYHITIECNTLKNYWVIPPFKLETSCYSEKVVELKRHLLHIIKLQSQRGNIRHVQNFAADIKALYNSVKHENHIFRFKNIIEENVYSELYERFLKLEWNLRRKLHRWWTSREGGIFSQDPSQLHPNILVPEALRMVNEEVRVVEETLEVHFSDSSEDIYSHIANKFKVEFMGRVESLKAQLEAHYTSKCSQVVILKRGLGNIIVEDFAQEELDPEETNFDATVYWKNAVAKYQSMTMKHSDIEDEFLQLLRRDMRTKGSFITERIHNITKLSDYDPTSFTYHATYDDESWLLNKCNHMENCVACQSKRKSVTKFLLEKSKKYVQKVVASETAYDPVHGMELLNMVNEVTREDAMSYTTLFELHLKLQILAQSAPLFQMKQNDLLQKCAMAMSHQGDEVINYLTYAQCDKIITKKYCQDWLKPAVELKVKKTFKQNLVRDFTNYMCTVTRSMPSAGSHGLRCVHHTPVVDTPEEICNRYTDRDKIQTLLNDLISSVISDIRKKLNHPEVLRSWDIGVLVAAVWSVLEGGHNPNPQFNVAVSNVLQCSYYLDFFVQKLEQQIQEEFRSKNIEEHYMDCPYRVHYGEQGAGL
ncbi:up-regulator of cell proliferation-like isoform X2 [Dendropsophus ebraccatus]